MKNKVKCDKEVKKLFKELNKRTTIKVKSVKSCD